MLKTIYLSIAVALCGTSFAEASFPTFNTKMGRSNKHQHVLFTLAQTQGYNKVRIDGVTYKITLDEKLIQSLAPAGTDFQAKRKEVKEAREFKKKWKRYKNKTIGNLKAKNNKKKWKKYKNQISGYLKAKQDKNKWKQFKNNLVGYEEANNRLNIRFTMYKVEKNKASYSYIKTGDANTGQTYCGTFTLTKTT